MRAPEADDNDTDDTDEKEAPTGSHTCITLTTGGALGKQKDLEQLPRPIRLTRKEVAVTDSEGQPASSIVWTPGQALSLQDRILICVRSNPGLSQDAVCLKVGGRKAACIEAVKGLVAAKLLDPVKEKGITKLYPVTT